MLGSCIGSRGIRGALVAAVVLACLSLAAFASGRAPEPLPPQGPAPAGANDPSCVTTRLHPYPVVLVHGTGGNMQVSWGSIVPPLRRLGYCVFALDYGNSPLPGINGIEDIPTSARQLQTFVDQVLDATGAAKVSIVGHSQGGMLPRQYIKFLGGASKVDDLVGLSPSNHGTTTPAAAGAGPFCPACAQQAAGSSFLQTLNAGDQTPAPVSYSVIETSFDEVVTPYASEFLPETADHRVTNVLLQDRCPNDTTEHVGIIFDPVAIQWMLNALGRPGPADPAFMPDCTGGTAAVDAFPNSRSVPNPGLRIRRATRPARSTRDRRITLVVRSDSPIEGTRVSVGRRISGSKTRLSRVGRSRRVAVKGVRRVVVRLRHPLSRGRYVLKAAGRDQFGEAVTATGMLKLRGPLHSRGA